MVARIFFKSHEVAANKTGATMFFMQTSTAKVELLQILAKTSALDNVIKLCPKLHIVLKNLKMRLLTSAKLVIANHCSSFTGFLTEFASVGKPEAILKEDFVGKVSTEGDGEDSTMCHAAFGKIFKLYFADQPARDQTMNVHSGDASFPLTCAAVCGGAGILPFAKDIVKLAFLIEENNAKKSSMASVLSKKNSAASEQDMETVKLRHLTTAISMQVAKAFESLKTACACIETVDGASGNGSKVLAGFREVLSSHLTKLTFLVNAELSECQQHVGSMIQAVLVEHKLGEIFEQTEIDQGMMKAACEDQRSKQLFNFAVFAKIALKDAKKFLKQLADFSSSDQVSFQDLVTKATALIKDVYSFSEEGCSENKGAFLFVVGLLVVLLWPRLWFVTYPQAKPAKD